MRRHENTAFSNGAVKMERMLSRVVLRTKTEEFVELSGFCVAWYDKAGFPEINHATQSNSPGSTIKPLVVYTPQSKQMGLCVKER